MPMTLSSRGHARAIGFTMALLLTALVAPAPADAAGTTALGTNLVKNGSAENGSPGTSVPGGWDIGGNFSVVSYGDPGVPSKSQSHSGGAQLFSSGAYDTTFDECGSATQFIHINGRGSAIDGGHIRVTLKARIGTQSQGTETATVTLQFRDANNEQVTSQQPTLGPLSTTRTLSSRSVSQKVPRRTREFRVQLLGSQTDPVCNAFFDNLSVVISSI